MQEINLKVLSVPAKGVAGAHFGMMGMKSHLRYGMSKGRPSPQMQKALNELVFHGVLKVESDNPLMGTLVYTPLVDCAKAFDWMRRNSKNPELKFPVSEDIPPEEQPTEALLTKYDKEIRKARKAGVEWHHPNWFTIVTFKDEMDADTIRRIINTQATDRYTSAAVTREAFACDEGFQGKYRPEVLQAVIDEFDFAAAKTTA